MTDIVAVVLWEDQLRLDAKNFGPHQLTLACLADELGDATQWDSWQLRRAIAGIPQKGAGTLKTKLRQPGQLVASGERLFAVFDDDEVRRLYGLERKACKSVVLESIRSTCPITSLTVVLLEENVETLVAAAARALGRAVPERKAPNVRDSILMKLAAESSRQRRDDVRAQVSSFERLVSCLINAIKK
jgi:hypothetical protein